MRTLSEITRDFACGVLDIPLSNLQFWMDDKCLLETSGRLISTGDRNLFICVDSPKRLSVEGSVLRAPNKITMKARLYDSITLSAPARVEITTMLFGEQEPGYRLPLHSCELKCASASDGGVTVRGYIDVNPFADEDANNCVDDERVLVSHSDTTILLRSEQGHYSVEMRSSDVADKPNIAAGALIYTLLMIAGRRVSWLTLVIDDGEMLTASLSSQEQRHNFLGRVAGSMSSEATYKVYKFFYQQPNHLLGKYTGLLWDYTGTEFDVLTLLLGVAIEGLSKEIFDEKIPTKDFKDFKSRVLNSIAKYSEECVPIELSAHDAEQLKSIVEFASPTTTRETIRLAAEAVGLSLTKEDTKAWSDMRNRPGHGRLSWDLPNEIDQLLYVHCEDLFKVLVSHLLGLGRRGLLRSADAFYPPSRDRQ